MILERASINYISQNRLQSLLAILGIAIGVAITLAIDISIESAKRSFDLSVERVTGKATHRLLSAQGDFIDEAVYTKLKVDLALSKIAPVLESYVTTLPKDFNYEQTTSITNRKKDLLKVLGLDPFAEIKFRKNVLDLSSSSKFFGSSSKPQALISANTATRLGLEIASSLTLRIGSKTRQVYISGLIKDESGRYDNLLLMDIAAAQALLGKPGLLSSIDILAENDSFASEKGSIISLEALSNELGLEYKIEEVSSRNKTSLEMTKAFNLNLMALSFLSLIVAVFLIYNSMSFSVVKRRRLLGIFRAIGVAKRSIIELILKEALVFAILGTLLGIVLGIFISGFLTDLITQTINDLYFTMELKQRKLELISLIKPVALGLVASLLAAFLPALDASSSSPLLAFKRSSVENHGILNYKVLSLLSLLLAVLALLVFSYQEPAFRLLRCFLFDSPILLSFFALALILLGLALLVPAWVVFSCKLLLPVFRAAFGFVGSLAIRSISTQLSRTAIAVATLMIAISVAIGLNITIKSFRYTVVNWLDRSLQSDIYISVPRLVSNQPSDPLPGSFVNEIKALLKDDIEEVLTYHNTVVNSDLGKIQLASVEASPYVYRLMKFKQGVDVWQKFTAGDSVIVSEPFASKKGISIGDSIHIFTKRGPKAFTVVGVFYDYGSDSGIVMMPKPSYQKFFEDYEVDSLGLILKNKASNKTSFVDDVIERIKNNFAVDYILSIRSNFKLKEESLQIFDRTFRVTDVLKLIAIIIAFIAVLNALMSLQLERIREFAILRATGVTPGQITMLLFLQTIVMGLQAFFFAIPAGIVQALVMILIINKQSFGWSLDFILPPGFYMEALILALTASVLAAIYPSIYSGRVNISQALRNE